MRRALYIVSAVLAAVGVAFYLSALIPNISWDMPDMWYGSISRFAHIGVIIVFAVLAIVQLKKSMPRLILLLSGAMFFHSIDLIAFQQWYGLFFLTAGILPAVLEISRVPKLTGRPQTVRERYDGLLMAAGVFALLNAAYILITSILSAFTYIALEIDLSFAVYLYAGNLSGIVQCICLGAFCFRKELRASVLYRMFFLGSASVGLLLMPASIAYYCMLPIVLFINVAQIPLITALALLALIHTAKTRHNSLLPQPPEGFAPPTDIPPTGYTY